MTSSEQMSPTSSRTAMEPDSSRHEHSPAVARIPYEIFKEIILYAHLYTPRPRKKDEYEDIQLVLPPIVASHVCRWWRHTLLSDPHMWTCLRIPQISPRGIIELLSRSDPESHLLYIFLRLGHYPELDDDDTATMLNILFKKIHRIKLLHLNINADDFPSGFYYVFVPTWIQHVLSYLQQPAPKLETFRFWYTDPEDTLHQSFLCTLFAGQAPNLKRLQIPFIHNPTQLPRPLFHDLSELHLTILSNTYVQFDHLLDFLQVLPRLKLFRVFSDWYSTGVQLQIPELLARKIHLVHLERFVLHVNREIGLADLFLEHVTFPKNIKWSIVSENLYGSIISLGYQELLHAVRFTSLHVRLTAIDRGVLSLKKFGKHGRQDLQVLNRSDDHELVYIFAKARELANCGPPMTVYTIVSVYPITHLFLQFGIKNHEVYPQLLALVPNVVSITIKQKIDDIFSSTEPWLYLLLALRPRKVDSNTDLSKDSDSDDSVSGSTGESGPQTTFPCPSLRELTIDLERRPLKKCHVSGLRKCHDKRQKDGLPLQIFARCSRMEEGLESMLQMGGGGMIHVSCSDYS